MTKWNITPPKTYHGDCLLTLIASNGERWVVEGWADATLGNGMMQGCVAWMDKPDHCYNNPEGWLSLYRGDYYPTKDGHYLVSTMHAPPNSNIPRSVKKLWFNANKQTFGGNDNFIAWMPLPSPYMGSLVKSGGTSSVALTGAVSSEEL